MLNSDNIFMRPRINFVQTAQSISTAYFSVGNVETENVTRRGIATIF